MASYIGELAALQAAAMWVSAITDFWQLYTGSRPSVVTLAVDNAAALQVAAGHAQATVPAARLTRQVWQAVQSRINTRFCHVHSHTGHLANSLADTLAGLATQYPQVSCVQHSKCDIATVTFEQDFPWLWLIPRCRLHNGVPCFVVKVSRKPPAKEPARAPVVPQPISSEAPSTLRQLDLHLITANIQTIKDSQPSIFNPSGLAARRQYLYAQMLQCTADVVCLQEARSRAGRWAGTGYLTWRSGALKGQYSCEIWIRTAAVQSPMQLQNWSILYSVPRILCVSSQLASFPLTVVSAHAPHADRPDREAVLFWRELTAVVRRAPRHRALVVGIDANADFHASDSEELLIGDLLSSAEQGRNDEMLMEFCLTTGLEAPATFSSTQRGDRWTWHHKW